MKKLMIKNILLIYQDKNIIVEIKYLFIYQKLKWLWLWYLDGYFIQIQINWFMNF